MTRKRHLVYRLCGGSYEEDMEICLRPDEHEKEPELKVTVTMCFHGNPSGKIVQKLETMPQNTLELTEFLLTLLKKKPPYEWCQVAKNYPLVAKALTIANAKG